MPRQRGKNRAHHGPAKNFYREIQYGAYITRMPGRICSACHHAKTQDIDDLLVSGATLRVVGERFSLSKSSVARHRSGCLAPRIAAALRAVAPSPAPRAEVVQAKAIVAGEVAPTSDDLLSLSALLARLSKSLGRLEDAADRAVTEDRPMVLAALSGQLHRGIETTAKLQGLGNAPPESAGSRTSLTIIIPERQLAPKAVDVESRRVLPAPADAASAPAREPERLVLRFGSPAA